MTASSVTVDDLLAGIPPEQLSARISRDVHLAEIARKVTRWSEVVSYLGLEEVDEEDIVEDNSRAQQRK